MQALVFYSLSVCWFYTWTHKSMFAVHSQHTTCKIVFLILNIHYFLRYQKQTSKAYIQIDSRLIQHGAFQIYLVGEHDELILSFSKFKIYLLQKMRLQINAYTAYPIIHQKLYSLEAQELSFPNELININVPLNISICGCWHPNVLMVKKNSFYGGEQCGICCRHLSVYIEL